LARQPSTRLVDLHINKLNDYLFGKPINTWRQNQYDFVIFGLKFGRIRIQARVVKYGRRPGMYSVGVTYYVNHRA